MAATTYDPPSIDDGFAVLGDLCKRCHSLVRKHVSFAFVLTFGEPCDRLVVSAEEDDREYFEFCSECSDAIRDRVDRCNLAATHCDLCRRPLAECSSTVLTRLITSYRKTKPRSVPTW